MLSPTRNTRIKPRSKKRSKQETLYRKVRRDYLALHSHCEVKDCLCEPTEIHHRKGRIGELLTDATWFLAVCRPHHNYIESHPAEAREAGYSLSRLAKND